MQKNRALTVALVAAFAAGGLASVTPTTANAVTADSSKKRLSYLVAPHPDDEWEGWSLVQNSPDNYNVFIVLTRGEGTGHCTGSGWEGEYGERHPEPYANTSNGFGAVNSSECKAHRLNSREAWLDKQAAHDGNLGSGSGMSRFRLNNAVLAGDETPKNDGVTVAFSDWQVGPKSARVVFDLGDGKLPDGTQDLTVGEVNWAIQTVRRNRDQLPSLPEGNIIGASYWNKNYSSCYRYEHADHRTVHVALWYYDQGTPGVQWGATCKDDPDVARTGTITNEIYSANMSPMTSSPGSNPSATRTGHFQVMYGWLAFDPGGYWPSGTNNQVLFSQSQAFWQRF